MADNRFASVPNISIPRSRFKQNFNHSTSFNHGELIPIDCFEILPGDTYKIDMAALIWMSNPIRPIFGNITAHVDVFFCPMRLVWDKTKEFFGENKTSAGYQTTQYKIPSVWLGRQHNVTSDKLCLNLGSISHYLGKPLIGLPSSDVSDAKFKKVSVLKERAYLEIWNNYYRSQQLQNPFIVTYSGNGVYGLSDLNYIGISPSGADVPLTTRVLKVNKEFDYFTAATLYPQYGPAVTLPLGTYAPIVTNGTTTHSLGSDPLLLGTATSAAVASSPIYMNWPSSPSNNANVYVDLAATASQSQPNLVDRTNLFADLTNATAATINSLRYAFAVQKYLERSNFGTRFFEMLQVHYGVTSPDASLQIPQRIGHADFPINISTVLSTAGAANDSSTELGMPGASSCTATNKYLCTHAFTEPGYLMIMLSTTHERSYTQGILREDLRQERYEIYSPEFANLGDQEILKAEIDYVPGGTTNNDVFGYQEHWAEYRYRPHRVSGLLDPQATGALDFWVLTDDYSSVPSLDGSWIFEDRTNLSRCLVSGATGPDYIGDFFFPYVATREMPLFTIPGLIDHFGSM